MSNEVRKIDRADWLKEGEERFGEDVFDWKFVCPNCDHIQSARDFRELHDLGLFKGSPDIAFFACIGRFDTRIPPAKVGTLGDPREYCNYTLGGLIPLNKTIVVDPDSTEHNVFEFAEAS